MWSYSKNWCGLRTSGKLACQPFPQPLRKSWRRTPSCVLIYQSFRSPNIHKRVTFQLYRIRQFNVWTQIIQPMLKLSIIHYTAFPSECFILHYFWCWYLPCLQKLVGFNDPIEALREIRKRKDNWRGWLRTCIKPLHFFHPSLLLFIYLGWEWCHIWNLVCFVNVWNLQATGFPVVCFDLKWAHASVVFLMLLVLC